MQSHCLGNSCLSFPITVHSSSALYLLLRYGDTLGTILGLALIYRVFESFEDYVVWLGHLGDLGWLLLSGSIVLKWLEDVSHFWGFLLSSLIFFRGNFVVNMHSPNQSAFLTTHGHNKWMRAHRAVLHVGTMHSWFHTCTVWTARYSHSLVAPIFILIYSFRKLYY